VKVIATGRDKETATSNMDGWIVFGHRKGIQVFYWKEIFKDGKYEWDWVPG
jgi:hypothetical protein